MIEIEWWDFDDVDSLATQAADDIGFVIESAIEARGDAIVALATGATGAAIAGRLAKTKLDWSKVTVVPTDGAGDVLAPIAGKGAAVIALDSAALADAHAPFDLVVLEAAADGAVAGIGIGPGFEAAINGPRGRRAAATPSGMTLTKAAFEGTRSLMIVGRGADARAAAERAIEDGPLSRAPLGRILADAEVDADILWSAG